MNNEREWQSIETAPKDGTRILIYMEGEPEWARHTVAFWSEMNTDWYGISASGGGTLEHHCPTHWMSLPAPPIVK